VYIRHKTEVENKIEELEVKKIFIKLAKKKIEKGKHKCF
jgi:hypothetical protein